MMVTDIINTKIFRFKSFFLSIFLVLVGGISLSAFLDLQLGYNKLAILGFLAFCIFPLIFLKSIMKMYKQKVSIEFEDNYFSVKYFKLNGEFVKQEDYLYKEVTSIVITPTSNIYSKFTAIFNDNSRLQLLFEDEKHSNSLLLHPTSEVLYKQIADKKNSEHPITLKPPFIASETGTIALVALSVMIILISIYFIIFFKKAAPYSFAISVSLFFQILASRFHQTKYYKHLKEL